MERLTKRIEDENILLTEVGDTACKCFCDNYTLSGCWECPVGKAIEKLATYEDLEERLHKIFGEESTFSLADVIDTLETQLSEPDKKHPVNARILTYEEANKWQEYKDLEE